MRLFLAVDLPEAVRDAVRETQAVLRSNLPGWRWLRVDGIHLTIRFLGEVGESELPGHRDAWRQTARRCSPLLLRLEGSGVFPSPRRPRVLWLGVHDRSNEGRLATLAAEIEQCCRERGFAPEPRGFRAHLTIARARRGAVARPPAAEPEPPRLSFESRELTLFRSRLAPSGATYARLESFPLGG